MRASICLVLVLLSTLTAVPFGSPTNHAFAQALPLINQFRLDPNGTLYAFNSTVSNLDIYTNASARVLGNGTLTWFSSVRNTLDGQPIIGTGFHVNMTGPNRRESINYTLNIPKGPGLPGASPTYVRIGWNGTVGPGTSARYVITNSTSDSNTDPTRIKASVSRPSNPPGTFFGSNSTSFTGGLPLPCGPTDECFDISSLIGFNITLTFLFNSTATATGVLKVTVSSVEVASMGPQTAAASHSMALNSNPGLIDHNGRLQVSYSSNVTYHKPNTTNQSLAHTWGTTILSFYLPLTYTSVNVTLRTTRIDNSTGPSGFFATHEFAQGGCETQGIVHCTRNFFFSVNVTSLSPASSENVFVEAQSSNALTSIRTGIGPVDTDFWNPGDNITVRVVNSPGVNATGIQTALLEPAAPSGLIAVNATLASSAKPGSANYTVAIPTSITTFGGWNLTITFISGFDLGVKTRTITIDELRVNSGFSVTGGVGFQRSIDITGKLGYLSGSSPVNGDVSLFAIGKGTGTSLLVNNSTTGVGLYMANITSVVGVGSRQQPITMYFTLINTLKTGNSTTKMFSANITVEHEWSLGVTHGVNVTIPLTSNNIDNGNNFLNNITYSLHALITASGVQLTLQSLTTNHQFTVSMTPGVGGSAVPFLRDHFGYFRITLHAKNNFTQVIETPQAIESPPYAYLLNAPLLPSRLLAYNSAVTSAPDGSFAASLGTDKLVGVSKLRVLALARDANGIVLGDETRDPTVFSGSTVLQPIADIPSTLAIGQSAEVTLHLKSNSTLVTSLRVNMDVKGPASVALQTKTITIQPGASVDEKFTIIPLSSAGTYTVTFWSPEYGGTGSPLLSKTLVVSLISSTLQVAIPVAIGLAAAGIITFVYYRRRQNVEDATPSEKTKTKTTGSPKPKPESQPRNP